MRNRLKGFKPTSSDVHETLAEDGVELENVISLKEFLSQNLPEPTEQALKIGVGVEGDGYIVVHDADNPCALYKKESDRKTLIGDRAALRKWFIAQTKLQKRRGVDVKTVGGAYACYLCYGENSTYTRINQWVSAGMLVNQLGQEPTGRGETEKDLAWLLRAYETLICLEKTHPETVDAWLTWLTGCDTKSLQKAAGRICVWDENKPKMLRMWPGGELRTDKWLQLALGPHKAGNSRRLYGLVNSADANTGDAPEDQLTHSACYDVEVGKSFGKNHLTLAVSLFEDGETDVEARDRWLQEKGWIDQNGEIRAAEALQAWTLHVLKTSVDTAELVLKTS